MALINCPECAKEISDKADACPSCGFPVARTLAAAVSESKVTVVECLGCHEQIPLDEELCPHCGLFNSQKYKHLQPEEPEEQQHTHAVKCPRCRSTSFTAGNKGFGLGKAAGGWVLLGPVGLLGGLLGSKKTLVTCLQCGHKWVPGRN